MNKEQKITVVLAALILAFISLAAAFHLNLWGKPAPLRPIPLVNPSFVKTDTARESYLQLVRQKADLADFDCYGCHDKKSPPPIRYDTNHNIIIPKEHANIVLGHGRHKRNNNCFNCHDEQKLDHFQTRDGSELTLAQSTPLCGSCHGPTYRDWEAGVHGRTSGYWLPTAGARERRECVDCHNPHSPKFPRRAPAPGPNALRPTVAANTKPAH